MYFVEEADLRVDSINDGIDKVDIDNLVDDIDERQEEITVVILKDKVVKV